MASGLMSPILWQSLPFSDNDAWLDFLQQHALWHRELAIQSLGPYRLFDDLRDNLQPNALVHRQLATFYGIAPIGDLVSFDLHSEESFRSWIFLESQDHLRFQAASGL